MNLNQSIFDTRAAAIVIPVNTAGAAGKGLAKQAASRWPLWEHAYKQACEDGRLTIGTVVAHHIPGHPVLVDFPTKRHWRERSTRGIIETGLTALSDWLLRHPEVHSIAIPALGCGLGGMTWEAVAPLLENFRRRSPAQVTIYPPHVTVCETRIDGQPAWYLRRSDGAVSAPFFNRDALVNVYEDGELLFRIL